MFPMLFAAVAASFGRKIHFEDSDAVRPRGIRRPWRCGGASSCCLDGYWQAAAGVGGAAGRLQLLGEAEGALLQ